MNFGLNFGLFGSAVGFEPLEPGTYIWYSYNPLEGYAVAADGNVVVDQDTVDPNYDGKVSASNLIYLNGVDQSVPYPVLHNLSAESVINGDFDTDSDWLKGGDWLISGGTAHTVGTTEDSIAQDCLIDGLNLVSFDLLVGEVRIYTNYPSFSDKATFVTSGKHTILLETQSEPRLYFYNNGAGTPAEIDNVSVKEITIPQNSALTYYDEATQMHVQVGESGVGSKELITNGDFSDGLNGWTTTGDSTQTLDGNTLTMLSSPVNNALSKNSLFGGSTIGKLNKLYRCVHNIANFVNSESGSIRLDGVYDANNIIAISESAPTVDFNAYTTFTTIDFIGSTSSTGYDISNVSLKQILPIFTTYHLTTSHQAVWNSTSPLTDAELAQLDEDPTLIYRVWFDALVLVDGFSKSDMGNFFGGNEGVASAEFVQDLSADLSAESVINGDFDTDSDWTKGGDWLISGGTAHTVGTTQDSIVQDCLVDGLNLVSFDLLGGEVRIYTNYPSFSDKGTFANSGKHTIWLETQSEPRLYFYNNGAGTPAEIDNVSAREATVAEILNYTESCRTTFLNQRFGANELRLLKDASGRVTNYINTNLARFDGTGQHIDTGVVVDGTISDFSMFMAFTTTESVKSTNQYLADTAGASTVNRLTIFTIGNDATNEIRVQIGKFVQDITLDTNNPIHALGVVFDLATSSIAVAVDGTAFPVSIPIVFDGPTTAQVVFGAHSTAGDDPWTGYIGEGILTASKLGEAQWQDFWTRNKDLVVP